MEHSIWQFFVDHRPSLVVDIAKALAAVGDETVLLPLTLILFVYGSVTRRRTVATIGPLLAMIPTVVVVGALKSVINRTRPPAVSALVEVTSASMPSGHAAYAAALAATAWVIVTPSTRATAWRTVAVGVAVLAGIARMVLGVHWFGDIAVGWAVGGAIGFCVVSALAKRLQSSR